MDQGPRIISTLKALIPSSGAEQAGRKIQSSENGQVTLAARRGTAKSLEAGETSDCCGGGSGKNKLMRMDYGHALIAVDLWACDPLLYMRHGEFRS